MSSSSSGSIADYNLYIVPLRHDEIMKAVADEHWQELRLLLKGTSTDHKLRTLRNYLEADLSACPVPKKEKVVREIRVVNYLNALLRGGQLKHVESQVVINR